MPGHRVPGAGGADPGPPLVRVQDQAVVPGAHEVALMGGEVESDNRLAAVGNRARLVLTVAGEPRLELGEVRRAGRAGSSGGDQARDRHVPAREHREPRLGAGGDLDLECLAGQAAGAQRREAAELGGVVRPGLGSGQRRHHTFHRRHLDRRVRVPRLAARAAPTRASASRAWPAPSGAPARRRPAPPRSGTRSPSRAAIVGVGVREPVAEQLRRRRRAAGTASAARARSARCRTGAVRTRGETRRGRSAAAGGASRRRYQKVVRIANASRRSSTSRSVGRPPVVGGVEEVGDPRRRVARGDRGAGHAREPQRSAGLVVARRRAPDRAGCRRVGGGRWRVGTIVGGELSVRGHDGG